MSTEQPVASPGRTSSKGSVAYVLKRFPRLSETFILNEILALEQAGLRLKIISIHHADTQVLHKHAALVRSPVYYLPESVLEEVPQLLWAQGHFLRRNPGRWIRTFAMMLFRHNPRAVRHWLKAGLAAWRLEETDTGHIHAHFSTSPTAIAMMASTLLGLRYSFTCHAKDVYAEGRIHSPGFGRNLERASFVVVVSKRTRQDVLDAWPALQKSKVHVVYNGIDLTRFQPRTAPPPGGTVLTVGRLVEKKGMPYLVEAFGILREKNVDFHGEIVGYGGKAKSLAEQIASLELGDRVRLLGPLPQDELIPHYRSASVFCLATVVAANEDRDILPNVVKEAMAIGVPVLTTSIPGMEELVEDGRSGLLVPSRDPEALSRGLEALLGDEELRNRFAHAGRQMIEDRFDRSKNTLRLLALFETQLGARNPLRVGPLAEPLPAS